MVSENRSSEPLWAWVIAGALLAGSALLPLMAGSFTGTWLGQVISVVAQIAFALAMAVFAFGWQGRGSVVARSVLGIVALVAIGVLPSGLSIVEAIIVPSLTSTGAYAVWSFVLAAIPAVAALAAGVEIYRARVVPMPWRVLPLVGLAVVALPHLALLVMNAMPHAIDMNSVAVWWGVASMSKTLLFLTAGVVAIVLGMQARESGTAERTTQIFPSR